MSACGGITLGAGYDCDNPIQPGVNQKLILMNKDDIAGYTYDGTLASLITDITLATGKQAFIFQGFKTSLSVQSEYAPGTNSIGYNHQADFLVYDVSQEQKDNLEKMAADKLVAIIENENVPGNGNSVFEVLGKGVGLELISNLRINADAETQGAYAIQLRTSDNGGKESKLPQSFWDTDYPTTKAKVDALLTPAP